MSNHIKAEIVRLLREEFDPCPPNYGGHSWHDCAEEVADNIVAMFASPQTDLVSRAEVLRVIRSLGDQDADLAVYGAADNARAREYGEAAATRACCAIALMPPASPSPAPAVVEELVARLAYRLKKATDDQVILDEVDADELLATLSTLAADKARAEAVSIAVLRYDRATPGNENEMPSVISCNWLPDGTYPVFLHPPASEAEIAGLRAERDRMRQALEPFANCAPMNVWRDESEDAGNFVLTENQFRAARQALSLAGEEQEKA